MEMVVGTADTHIPPYEYLLYTIIYLFFPFLYFSQRKSHLSFEPLFKAILYSGILFSIVMIIRFIQIRMEYDRFDRFLLGFDPLTISYVGSLVVGICFSRLVFNRNYENTRLLLAGILFGLCPFLLGGSRGPIIALVIPILFAYMYRTRIVITKKSLWYGLLIVIALTVALIIFGDIAFERLNNIFNDLASKSGDVRRLRIWNIALSQFLESPVWGDSIQINYLDYPHNLILEVLMSTGILGFIPFFILMGLGLYKSFIILRRYPSLIWLYIFFFQALIMGMLSGTVYNNIWYWASLALIFSIDTSEINRVEKNPAISTSI